MQQQILLSLIDELDNQVEEAKVSHQFLREDVDRLLFLMTLKQIHRLSQHTSNSLPTGSHITHIIIVYVIQHLIRKRIVDLVDASQGLMRGVALDRDAALHHFEEVVGDAIQLMV